MATKKFCKRFIDAQGRPLVGALLSLEDVQGLRGPYALVEIPGDALDPASQGHYQHNAVETGTYRVLRGAEDTGWEESVAPGRFPQGTADGLVDAVLRTRIYAREFGEPTAETIQKALSYAASEAGPGCSPTVVLSHEPWRLEATVQIYHQITLDGNGAWIERAPSFETSSEPMFVVQSGARLRRARLLGYCGQSLPTRPVVVRAATGSGFNARIALEQLTIDTNPHHDGIDLPVGSAGSILSGIEYVGSGQAIQTHGIALTEFALVGCFDAGAGPGQRLTNALTGAFRGAFTGDLVGDTAGTHTGPVTGDTAGTHTGPVVGPVTGPVTGDTAGTHTGPVVGDCAGSHTGSVNGATLQPYKTNVLTFLAANTGGVDAAGTGEFAWMYHGVKDGRAGGSACTLYAKLPYGAANRNLTQPVVVRLPHVNASFRGAPAYPRYVPVVVTVQEDSGVLRGHKTAYAVFAPAGPGNLATNIALYKADGTPATFGDLATVSTDALILQFSDHTLGLPTPLDP